MGSWRSNGPSCVDIVTVAGWNCLPVAEGSSRPSQRQCRLARSANGRPGAPESEWYKRNTSGSLYHEASPARPSSTASPWSVGVWRRSTRPTFIATFTSSRVVPEIDVPGLLEPPFRRSRRTDVVVVDPSLPIRGRGSPPRVPLQATTRPRSPSVASSRGPPNRTGFGRTAGLGSTRRDRCHRVCDIQVRATWSVSFESRSRCQPVSTESYHSFRDQLYPIGQLAAEDARAVVASNRPAM